MQRSIATPQRESAPENRAIQVAKSSLFWIWSMSVTLGRKTASLLYRVVQRLGPEIPDTVNINRISAQLDVLRRARIDGRKEYPPSGEEAISGTQREIVAHFRDLQRNAQRQINILADKLRRLREKIDLTDAEGKLDDIPSQCENDVRRMLADSRSRFSSSKDDISVHSQPRPPEELTGRRFPIVFQLAFLAILITVGSILIGKTAIFEPSVDSQVPPPWIFMTFLAVVILSATTALGVSTSISHRGTTWKLRKLLRAVTGIVFVGLVSVFASHHLVAMAAEPGTSLPAVFDAILVERTVPLLLFEDWIVIAIVLVAALLAFIICYQPDTKAHEEEVALGPGRRRTRRKRERLAKQLRELANAKIDRAQTEASAILKRSKTEISKYARLVDESSRLPAKLSEFELILEDACGVLLDRYRAENRKMRTTQSPHSFQEHVCFRPEYESSLATLADEGRRLAEYQQKVSDLETQAIQVRQKLRDLNSRTINTVEEFTAL